MTSMYRLLKKHEVKKSLKYKNNLIHDNLDIFGRMILDTKYKYLYGEKKHNEKGSAVRHQNMRKA